MPNALPPERIAAARQAIDQWRLDPDTPVACPVCASLGLEVIDRSARPYAEWYALRCTACDLDHTLQIPLAPPPLGGMD